LGLNKINPLKLPKQTIEVGVFEHERRNVVVTISHRTRTIFFPKLFVREERSKKERVVWVVVFDFF
jgi:hypothetical protein